MSKQLTLPLKLNHNRASKTSPQLQLQLSNPDWIDEAVERYQRKKNSINSPKPNRNENV
jgi:hypothetical protein